MKLQSSVFPFLGFLFSINSFAATYYVATNGSDTYQGTSSQPFRTIAHAVNRMNPGDTTYVRGGIYREGPIRFKKSGSQVSPIKLLSAPDSSPVIDFSGAPKTTYPRILVQHSSGERYAMGYITIEGFEIKNGHDGIKFHNMHNSFIRRNWIHDNRTQGILGGGGHHIVFDRNRINHNGRFAGCAAGELDSQGTSVCNKDHGLYMNGSYFTLTNNLIYDNLSFGIQVNGSSSSYSPTKYPSPEFAGASHWIIANNTLAYNHYRAGIVLWGTVLNSRIENNIFYENNVRGKSTDTQGINMSPGVREATIRNNLFYASGGGGILPYSSAAIPGINYTQSGNIVNTANPRFVTAPATMPTSPNFALTSLSPAINRGLTNSLVGFDFLGVPRPRGGALDIGAYEFVSGPLPRPPSGISILSDN